MTDALSQIRTRNTVTPQTEQADSRQVKNSAGGYSFEVAGEDRIKRFLTLGTDGGSYYKGERELTKENAAVVIDWAVNRSSDLVLIVRDISVAGRAPKQNPALFALAAVFAFGDEAGKKLAQVYFNDIVRTGTHLFTFVGYAEQFRGWGRGLKKAVGSWYLGKDVTDLSYQMVKYRQRGNWNHQNVLRQAHVGWDRYVGGERSALLNWASPGTRYHGENGKPGAPRRGVKAVERVGWVAPFEIAQSLGKNPPTGPRAKTVFADLIREFPGLPWEALPDVALTYPETWEALLENVMPITALIRQLPRLTNLGLAGKGTVLSIVSQLTDEDKLRKGRVHPVKLLYALKTYAQGRSSGQGGSTWTPSQRITDALDAAFYLSFGTMEAAGKRTMLAIDVSASMTWPQNMCGVLQAREGATAMAMATAATEPEYLITAFSHGLTEMAVSPRRRLDDNLRTVESMYAGGTDCSLPMTWAQANKREIDTFVVYTDNETYAGRAHPHEALRQYRQATGIPARLVVAGMSSGGFTIADPSDKGMLDVAGFDSDTPSVISDFSRGDFG